MRTYGGVSTIMRLIRQIQDCTNLVTTGEWRRVVGAPPTTPTLPLPTLLLPGPSTHATVKCSPLTRM